MGRRARAAGGTPRPEGREGLSLFALAVALRGGTLAAAAGGLALGQRSASLPLLELFLALASALGAGLGALGIAGLLRFARGQGRGAAARSGVLLLAAAAFLDLWFLSLVLDLASGELDRMAGAGRALGAARGSAELAFLLALLASLLACRRAARSAGEHALGREAGGAAALVGFVAACLAASFALALARPAGDPSSRLFVALGLLVALVAVALRTASVAARLASALARRPPEPPTRIEA